MAETVTFGAASKALTHIFIINPYAGNCDFAGALREKLNSMKGIRFFLFNTQYEGQETEMVAKIIDMFADERLRIYVCGGSGTFRNVINGIGNLSEVELAFFPCGKNNDYLRGFGNQYSLFENIDNLIDGKVIDVDYLKSNGGIMLSSLSFGANGNIINKINEMYSFRVIHERVPYLLGMLRGLLFYKCHAYEIVVDEKRYVNKFAQIFFGNSGILSKELHFANPKFVNIMDGVAEYRIVKGMSGMGVWRNIKFLKNSNFKAMDEVSFSGNTQKMVIRRTDGRPFSVVQDGELVSRNSKWEVEVVPQGLHFVVPREASYEQRG